MDNATGLVYSLSLVLNHDFLVLFSPSSLVFSLLYFVYLGAPYAFNDISIAYRKKIIQTQTNNLTRSNPISYRCFDLVTSVGLGWFHLITSQIDEVLLDWKDRKSPKLTSNRPMHTPSLVTYIFACLNIYIMISCAWWIRS